MNLRFQERLSYALGAVGKDMAYALASSYVLYRKYILMDEKMAEITASLQGGNRNER